jgi:hypothetical protein
MSDADPAMLAKAREADARVERADRAEQHTEDLYRSAGVLYKELREECKAKGINWVPWSKENIKSGTTKVYDCIAIADGKKTLVDIRAAHRSTRVSPRGEKNQVLLSPQRKTLNSALTKTVKVLSDEQVEAVVHITKTLATLSASRTEAFISYVEKFNATAS